MENLLVLLNKIQQLSPLSIFDEEVIVVQNAGMQHWLNLSLAEQRGISMNMRYALPAQFLWKLIRTLASDEVVPEQSPYSREVLTWRIDALLSLNTTVNDPDFNQATDYWLDKKELNHVSADNLKRYQLAQQLADLYEQYLIFRPEWIDAWQRGDFTVGENVNAHFHDSGQAPNHDINLGANLENSLGDAFLWQGKLWQLLTEQQAYNPVSLLENAIQNISKNLHELPKRLSFFGINTMAPMWLTFIHALSEHVEVHFFHLNPCFAYWGDIVSEKQAHKQINHWVEHVDDPQAFVGNPLLANLGQQGREFMALLQNYSTVNIDAFEDINDTLSSTESLSALMRLQHDILTLTDARSSKDASNQKTAFVDDSIVITSCHSALREVQGLHDYLLHQFNNDSSLTPKDVLVMCPQIEHYAPFVNAVFARGWQDIGDSIPPLPCSIADRSAKDSEPLIAAFTELLTLPDSRFQVSQLMSFLRLPAMATKFDITTESLDKITVWLDQASIHWGLDAKHKQQILSNDTTTPSYETLNSHFTWQQGLSRLLQGFAFADSDVIYKKQLLLSSIEGSDAILLGKLMLIIEQLQAFSQQLNTARTAVQWQQFLLDNLTELFDTENEPSMMVIEQAIADLVEYCFHAHYQQSIELVIVKEFLDNHFSQPDPGRQFMVGQVTFCSMLPMRSIPFKIIAVLGLNDGEFPRQRQPLGFDLMELTPAKMGDRSRRGDDRYLFLEAIISARQALYLSYQGRNIKNNTEKQASLVLKELMDYLALGYGWSFEEDNSAIRHLPMQAFSEKNYQKNHQQDCQKNNQKNSQKFYPSFDAKWLALGKNQAENDTESLVLSSDSIAKQSDQTASHEAPAMGIHTSDLLRFYQHPSKAFAQQQLQLYFDQKDNLLEDSEPFKADGLQTYLLREALLASLMTSNSTASSSGTADVDTADVDIGVEIDVEIDKVLLRATLSDKFPDLPTTSSYFHELVQHSKQLHDEIDKHQLTNPELVEVVLNLTIKRFDLSDEAGIERVNEGVNDTVNQGVYQKVQLTAQLPIKDNQLVFYRSSSAKGKDLFNLYLHQLIVQVFQDQQITSTALVREEVSDSVPNLAQDSLTGIRNKEQDQIESLVQTTGFYFDTKAQKVSQYICADILDAKNTLQQLLATYLLGKQQPLLLNGDLAAQVHKCKGFDNLLDNSLDNLSGNSSGNSVDNSVENSANKTHFTQEQLEKFWQSDFNMPGFGEDPYIQYFWPQCPEYKTHEILLAAVYKPMYLALEKVKAPKKAEQAKGAK